MLIQYLIHICSLFASKTIFLTNSDKNLLLILHDNNLNLFVLKNAYLPTLTHQLDQHYILRSVKEPGFVGKENVRQYLHTEKWNEGSEMIKFKFTATLFSTNKCSSFVEIDFEAKNDINNLIRKLKTLLFAINMEKFEEVKFSNDNFKTSIESGALSYSVNSLSPFFKVGLVFTENMEFDIVHTKRGESKFNLEYNEDGSYIISQNKTSIQNMTNEQSSFKIDYIFLFMTIGKFKAYCVNHLNEQNINFSPIQSAGKAFLGIDIFKTL